MTILHFINCAALAFAPHVIYYKATPLSEYGTLHVSLKAAVVYLATAFVKLILLATLLRDSEDDPIKDSHQFDLQQEILKTIIGFSDIAGLYFALTQISYRNISFSHKFQSVGLGWALSDSLLKRLLPFWLNARGFEFDSKFLLQAIESNANLVLIISLSALASLMWLKKNKINIFSPFIYVLSCFIICIPTICNYLENVLLWELYKIVIFQIFSSLFAAFLTWQIFSSQRL